jgi:hypothetical protein
MKNLKPIFFLTAILMIIIFAWLIPKTRGEKKTHYVRVYTEEKKTEDPKQETEDKDQDQKTDVQKDVKKKEEKKVKKERVVVQRDTLNGNFKMKDLKMSLYSRSMHFEPLEEVATSDSSSTIISLETDSSKIEN